MKHEPLVLDARVPQEFGRWERLWRRWPGREVWAHPAYARLFAPLGGAALCVAIDLPEGGILFPVLVRSLGSEVWTRAKEGSWDATSPYGYGGGFAWGTGREVGPAFWSWLEEWLRSRGVVALFCRVALFSEQLLPGMPGLSFDRFNVVRSTTEPPDVVWQNYAHKVRKNVKRARAEGLVCRREVGAGQLKTFVEIYHDTLRRRQAGGLVLLPSLISSGN